MSWRRRFNRFWNESTETKAFVLSIIASVIATPIFPWIQKSFPTFWTTLHLPDASFLWLIELAVSVTLGLVVLSRHRASSSGSTHGSLVAGTTGGAYIMLEVVPGASKQVAEDLCKIERVNYAAGVWGQWDVVARVSAGTAASFVQVLNEVQADKRVLRTETQLVRSDQTPVDKPSGAPEDHFAFLLLKVPVRDTYGVLEEIRKLNDRPGYAHVAHAVGVLGTYDLALTVRYSKDDELAKLVMEFFQAQLGVETVTVPAIRGMTYAAAN